jgi:hypothetical protein
MTRFKACVVCGRPIAIGRARCEKHSIPRPPRSGSYTRVAKRVRDDALARGLPCAICGQPFTADDPPVADHVLPRLLGGADTEDNLRAVHLSCNGRRGRELVGYWPR